MQPRNKTWKVEETTSAFFVTEIDDRHTFNISKKMVQNYVVDYDPAFTEDLHYFDLLNGQVLFFSEVDVMLTEPRKSGEDGPAVIYELSDVLNEAFSLIRSAKPLAAHSLTVRRQVRESNSDAVYKLTLFAKLGFRPAEEFARILAQAA